MVKFVGLVLLGFAACVAVAIPPSEDSNGRIRIRRHSVPNQGSSQMVPHGDHFDTLIQNPDGSVTRTHHVGGHGGSTYQTLHDSNGHIRIRRHSIGNPISGFTQVIPHGDHFDEIDRKSDGSVTRTHLGGSHGGSTYRTVHNDHDDTIEQHPDGFTRIHNTRGGFGLSNGGGFGLSNGGGFGVSNGGFDTQPIYPNYNTGYNGNYNRGQINVPIHDHGHGPHDHHPGAAVEIVKFSTDPHGHDIATKTEVFEDGHTHERTVHL